MDHSSLVPPPPPPPPVSGNLGICPGYTSSKFHVVETRDSVMFLWGILFLAAIYLATFNLSSVPSWGSSWTPGPFGLLSAGLLLSALRSSSRGLSQRFGRGRSQSLLFAFLCGFPSLLSDAVLVIDAIFWFKTQPRPWVDSKFEPLSMISAAACSWAKGQREAAQWALLHISMSSSSYVSCSPGPSDSSLCIFWPEFIIVFCWRVGSMWANLQ